MTDFDRILKELRKDTNKELKVYTGNLIAYYERDKHTQTDLWFDKNGNYVYTNVKPNC